MLYAWFNVCVYFKQTCVQDPLYLIRSDSSSVPIQLWSSLLEIRRFQVCAVSFHFDFEPIEWLTDQYKDDGIFTNHKNIVIKGTVSN